jgi:hypothetical protein
VSLARLPWFILILFGLLAFASRYPLAPGQLFTFDDVNFAYSIGHFDIRASQPHPPGYPLFVMELRALWFLRFRHVEHLLFALAVAGSAVTLFLLAVCGNRMMGGHSGFFAAWLLLFNPVFWHAGVTSALRVQLALVSIAVAAGCWSAWRGNGRAVLWSAVALAIGAGIRPETGLLLFPLWAASALRAPVAWRDRAIALAAMAGVVALWLAPTMIASGGPLTFIRTCLDYVTDQASVSSGLFGASDRRWQTTFWRTVVWTFCILPGCALPAVLAWRRRQGWSFGVDRLAFLSLWFLPAFAFGLLVHLEDPGHTLAMVPAVALWGGYLMSRGLETLGQRVGQGHGMVLALATLAIAWIVDRHNAEFTVIWLPAVCLAAGLLLKVRPVKNFGHLPEWQAAVILLAPVILLNWTMFFHRGWYYRGPDTAGWRGSVERMTADLNSGLALTSYEQIQDTLAVDDHSVREVRRLAAEKPERALVIWERGLTAWRKIAYYAPDLAIDVLEHKLIRAGSPAVVTRWRGALRETRTQGAAPLRIEVPAGMRVIWVLNPASEFYRAISHAFPLTPAGPVWHTDLPLGGGSRVVGDYEVAW